MNGQLRRVMADKGFAFIRGEDGNEYFMHRSAISDGSIFETLHEGQAVTFDPAEHEKGPRAENVRVILGCLSISPRLIASVWTRGVEWMRAFVAEREWGWWRLLKAALALAHSGAVVVVALMLVGGEGYDVIVVALLGLPWSIADFIGFADGTSAGAWARAHKWVPLMLLFLAMGLNSALLWFWTLFGDKGLIDHDRPVGLFDLDRD